MRSLIAKKENDVLESGAQLRSTDPETPSEGQVWINTTDKKMCFFDSMVKSLMAGYVEGGEPSHIRELSLLDVDWSAGNFFRKRNISGETSFTFSNLVEGEKVTLLAIAGSIANAEIILPPEVKKVASDDYFLDAGKGIVVEVKLLNGVGNMDWN